MMEKRHVIGHRKYDGKQRNPRGNVVDTWTDPVDVEVYGWYVNNTHEPQLPGHERVKGEVQVLAGPEFYPNEKDIVVLPIGEFEVVGYPQDYNHGPFDWAPGNVINLERVKG